MANTGNQMIDLLLNSRLAAAQDAGIAVELQLAQAPERLGLSDTELCSLLMNLLDNAVAGAQAPVWRSRISSWTCISKTAFLCSSVKTPPHGNGWSGSIEKSPCRRMGWVRKLFSRS